MKYLIFFLLGFITDKAVEEYYNYSHLSQFKNCINSLTPRNECPKTLIWGDFESIIRFQPEFWQELL